MPLVWILNSMSIASKIKFISKSYWPTYKLAVYGQDIRHWITFAYWFKIRIRRRVTNLFNFFDKYTVKKAFNFLLHCITVSCKEEVVEGFTFPETIKDGKARSKETCPSGEFMKKK